MPAYRLARSLAAVMLVGVPITVQDEHVVVPGDTLVEIAESHNTTARAIAEANDLGDPDVIRPGEVLRLPGGSRFHRVAMGETLAEIARAYGTTTQALATANGIVDPDLIFSGSRLQVRGGSSTGPEAGSTGTSTYVVQAGDRLGDLAARFGVTSADLLALNDLADPNVLTIGQRLVVPALRFTCPVAGATYRNDFGVPKPDGRFHQGIDLFAPGGTPVVAPVAGRVEQVDGSRGGRQFWLHGADGNLYVGTHMSDFGVAGRVSAGELVGFVGTTGNAAATSPHLHFEMVVDGESVNPYPTLRENGC